MYTFCITGYNVCHYAWHYVKYQAFLVYGIAYYTLYSIQNALHYKVYGMQYTIYIILHARQCIQ